MCIDHMDLELSYTVNKSSAEQTFPRTAKSYVKNNKRVNEDVRAGDLLRIKKRHKNYHWAIFIGGNEVIHLDGFIEASTDDNSAHLFEICGVKYNSAKVVIDDFWHVVGSDKVQIKNNDDVLRPLHEDQIIQNATGKLGEVNHEFVYSNCKDFVHWCRYGEREISQEKNLEMSHYSYLEGDIIEFHLGKMSSYGIYVGNGMIVHPAADKISNEVIICIDELRDVPGKPQVFNYLDKQKNPQSLEEMLDVALLNIGSSTKLDSLQFATLCRYGKVDEKQHWRLLVLTSVGLGTALISYLGIFQEISSSLLIHAFQICESVVICCALKALRKIRQNLCSENRSCSDTQVSHPDLNSNIEDEKQKKCVSWLSKANGRLFNGRVKQILRSLFQHEMRLLALTLT